MVEMDELEREQLRKIFVGGLSIETTDESLKSYFEKFGTVVEAVVMKNTKNKRSRGFGFVTFMECSMKENAQRIEHTIDGNIVALREPYQRRVLNPDLDRSLWYQKRRRKRLRPNHGIHRSRGPKRNNLKKKTTVEMVPEALGNQLPN
ncbi:heterogeneous nuclear ribonucleoprotein A1-like [Drosophila eugracilis]|uniref:heterogeneous nuclear ribonucleoprotein A1-like n=1 Tax=Drosophila eugracilis TaxID=29029 RepID=UPI0007E61F17|nr:heterogeneous nuclear ribonucleoprotein A1-like [Drosophila eugracilis]